MEILAPIKNLNNAKIAIKNGADAMYLASPNFGARVNASLTLDEIKSIIKLANSHDVKTYITFNTVVFDDEVELFFEQISKIYLMGASGVILQDIAFCKIVKQNFQDLEVHASTQMHIHNTNGVEILLDQGVKRVVVPREMSFEMIKKIKQTKIEVEAFVHGALCVCYSGQCYDSTLLDQKSANRGRCSQYCRMQGDVTNIRNGKVLYNEVHPLNLKDLNSLDNLGIFNEVGADSLKIEGRLKGIDYVGLTTSRYKDAKSGKIVNDLQRVYNREFTNGRISKVNGAELVNLNRSNNNGIKIGKIIGYEINKNKKLGFYKYILKLKLDSNIQINTGDNLRFIYGNFEVGQLVEQLECPDKDVLLYSNFKLQKGDVYRTKEIGLINTYLHDIQDVKSKYEVIDVDIYFELNKVRYIINKQEYFITLDIFDAKNHPLDYQSVSKVLSKTKDTDYKINIGALEFDGNLFIRNKDLKKLRDDIIRNAKNKRELQDFVLNTGHGTVEKSNSPAEYYFFLRDLKQVEYFQRVMPKDYKFKINLVINFKIANEVNVCELEEKFKVYLELPRIIYDYDNAKVCDMISNFNNLVISEIGSFKYKKLITGEIITNFTFNTTNKINQNFLNENGATSQILSIELNKNKIKNFNLNSSILNIYGKIPVMIMDYCPINLDKIDDCGECRRCRTGNYEIHDNFGRKFPLIYEGDGKIGLYTKKPISLFDEISNLDNINKFMIALVDEGVEEINSIIKSIKTNKNIINKSFKGNFHKDVL